MKFVTITLAVVFNLTVLLIYSRGLAGGPRTGENGTPESRPGARARLAERSASAPIERGATSVESGARAAKNGEGREGKEVAEPVRDGGEGKETIDPKDAKGVLEPVAAENGQALRLRGGPGQPSTEIMPGTERAAGGRVLGPRGILGPANPANVDPPVVSPEAP
jgi:hypothetical protein